MTSTALELRDKVQWLVTQNGDPDFTEMLRGSAETDLAQYRRGEIPPAQKVEAPSGAALLKLSAEERQMAAWDFFSTTQGRRSAVSVIRRLIAEELSKAGFEIREREFDKNLDVTVWGFSKWAINLSGRGSLKPAFSLIDVAAKALKAGIHRSLQTGHPQEMILEVESVNNYKDREVGWAARLVS